MSVLFLLRRIIAAQISRSRLLLSTAMLFLLALTAQAQTPVQIENAKAGTTSWLLTNAAANREIEGYASLTSVNRGGQISLYVSTSDSSYTMEIYRLGWYGGAGARQVMSAVSRTGTKQTTPTPNPDTGMVECNWTNPYVLTIPNSTDVTDWMSGVYLVKLTAGTSKKQAYIIFAVRDDARRSDFLFQSSVTTYQAYNNWGGKSLYGWNSSGGVPAVKVSFNRPYAKSANSAAVNYVGSGEFITNIQQASETFAAGWEYNMVRFLEREGYDVTYCTDLDTHQNGSLLLNHKGFLSVGHDEYWSYQMRANVEAARDAGVSLGFFGANICYWQVRFENSSTGAANRTMVGYKDASSYEDPYATDTDKTNDKYVTTTWRSAPLNRPEDALIGVMYEANPVDAAVVITNASNWVFANTGLANGDTLPGLVGYEVDRMYGNAPTGTVRLAHSPYDNGGLKYSDMTVYTASSGATVFATGSMQWSWGLDDYNSPGLRPSRINLAAQQITRNVLARFKGAAVPNPTPTPTPSPTPTPITGATFSDDFNDNTRDTAKWTLATLNDDASAWDSLVTVLEQNQRVEITPRSGVSGLHYNGYVSAAAWNMTNSMASVEVVQVAVSGADTIFAIGIDSSNWYRFVVEDDQLYFQDEVNGVKNSTNIAYNPVSHRFWRFRHNTANDSILFETSPDGVTWTVRRTVTRSISITALKIEMDAGTFAATSSPGKAIFDNFRLDSNNPAPTPTPTPTPTPSPTATPTPTPTPTSSPTPTPTPLPTPTPGVTFSDDFNDNTRDTAKWTLATLNDDASAWDSLVTVLEQNQRVEITPRSGVSGLHYNGYVSVNTYDLTNASAGVEVIQTAVNGADTIFAIGIDSSNWYRFVVEDGQLYFQDEVNGVKNSTNLTYNSTQHRFWRFRHNPTGDQIVFETSADGLTWIVQRSIQRQLNITALRLEIDAGTYSAVGTPGKAIFDNFQLIGSGTTPPPSNQPPVSRPGGPYTGTTGQQIQFNGGTSSDPDGTISSYQWNFGDGTTATSATPTKAYTTAGTYTVTLTVTDNGGLTNTASTTATISATATVPAAPSNLTASSTTSRQVVLNWTDNSSNEQNFIIQRSTSPTSGFSQIATVGANVTTYTNTGLTSGRTYYFRVRAKNATGNSAFSNTASVVVR